MRVMLLAGCLEPGKDGVGDYTADLAAQATACGAICQLVAVADRHVDVVTRSSASEVPILRLPDRLAVSQRLSRVESAATAFRPEWVSLQFTPFSFDPWGIPSRFLRSLPEIIGSARLHVMFHEVWVGRNGSVRRWLMSEAQRTTILSLVRRARPVSHTTTEVYRRMLLAGGCDASVLPVFGSVPIDRRDGMCWLGPKLAAAGCDVVRLREGWWIGVFFGTLQADWRPEPVIEGVMAAAADAGRRLALVCMGRTGARRAVWSELETRYAGKVTMMHLGELSGHTISQVFQCADFGVATSPIGLVTKSASAAAMLEHGLPVLVDRQDVPLLDADGLFSGVAAPGQIARNVSTLAAVLSSGRTFKRWRGSRRVATEWLTALQRDNRSPPSTAGAEVCA